jgi:hypothetical protein
LSTALAELSRVLRAQGGLVGAVTIDGENGAGQAPDGLAALAASGPRTRSRARAYELVVETVYEGYLLHYGDARIVRTEDADLGLLAGDSLYALGLARLVELGDVEAVVELADVISLAALARSAADAELADAVWTAGAHALGWGSNPEHAQAKEMARVGSPGAAAALLAATVARADDEDRQDLL